MPPVPGPSYTASIQHGHRASRNAHGTEDLLASSTSTFNTVQCPSDLPLCTPIKRRLARCSALPAPCGDNRPLCIAIERRWRLVRGSLHDRAPPQQASPLHALFVPDPSLYRLTACVPSPLTACILWLCSSGQHLDPLLPVVASYPCLLYSYLYYHVFLLSSAIKSTQHPAACPTSSGVGREGRHRPRHHPSVYLASSPSRQLNAHRRFCLRHLASSLAGLRVQLSVLLNRIGRNRCPITIIAPISSSLLLHVGRPWLGSHLFLLSLSLAFHDLSSF
ncbi:hypothetical protein BD310DRAFT_391046 [Dichomitus squalens]|uniref:Uncharacterized protein n=1 Tax=Dichomitus squalens TaxID=114155 RepID=A0A4Q9Q9J1_9APHY|nr:hypothetical protein BD310DRAFT_391046 [Dichomitus squalens]